MSGNNLSTESQYCSRKASSGSSGSEEREENKEGRKKGGKDAGLKRKGGIERGNETRNAGI